MQRVTYCLLSHEISPCTDLHRDVCSLVKVLPLDLQIYQRLSGQFQRVWVSTFVKCLYFPLELACQQIQIQTAPCSASEWASLVDSACLRIKTVDSILFYMWDFNFLDKVTSWKTVHW